MTILHIAPYVTMVMSVPSRKISGLPRGTVISPILDGILSFSLYPLRHSMISAGSSDFKRVLYIPAAWVIFLGTQTSIPRKLPKIMLIGEPESHTRSEERRVG